MGHTTHDADASGLVTVRCVWQKNTTVDVDPKFLWFLFLFACQATHFVTIGMRVCAQYMYMCVCSAGMIVLTFFARARRYPTLRHRPLQHPPNPSLSWGALRPASAAHSPSTTIAYPPRRVPLGRGTPCASIAGGLGGDGSAPAEAGTPPPTAAPGSAGGALGACGSAAAVRCNRASAAAPARSAASLLLPGGGGHVRQ